MTLDPPGDTEGGATSGASTAWEPSSSGGATDDGSTRGEESSASSDTGDLPEPVAPGDPVLLFTDLTSGPSTGWQGSDERGAAVTVWGRNFGDARGQSTITVDGIALEDDADYVGWGMPAVHPGLQTITFLVPAEVSAGDVELGVTVDGADSNALPFTVRPGALRYVAVEGSGTGDGSWVSPWATPQQAIDAMSPGDIAYLGDGVTATSDTGYNAVINLSKHGEPDRPLALVALPGSSVRIGSPSVQRAIHHWVGSDGSYADYWTIAGLELTCGETCINLGTGSRAVGNRITAPQGNGQTGCVNASEGEALVLGNELVDVGAADASKLYHAIYISGPRTGSPPRLPPAGDYEIAWNYVHDNASNRAINVYSEQDYSAFVRNVSVHDNLIVDQRGDGILIGWYTTGEIEVFNNVIVRAGLGPEWSDGVSSHAGIRLDAGHAEAASTVIVAHNTVVDAGYARAEFALSGALLLSAQRGTIELRYNVFAGGQEPALAGDSVALTEQGWANLWFPGAPAWAGDAVTEPPAFVDVAALDYRPVGTSAAVDATADDPLAIATHDHAGLSRPQGAGLDLGAHEHVSMDSP